MPSTICPLTVDSAGPSWLVSVATGSVTMVLARNESHSLRTAVDCTPDLECGSRSVSSAAGSSEKSVKATQYESILTTTSFNTSLC